jgi:flagellar motor switch protein FliN/FliY
MQAPEISKTCKALGLAFSHVLSRSLGEASHSNWETGLSDDQASLPKDSESASYFRFTFSGGLQGELHLVVKHAEALLLGLRDVADDNGTFEDEHAAALLAMLTGCTNDLRVVLQEHGALEIQVERSVSNDLREENSVEIWAQADDQANRVSFQLFFDAKFVLSLQASAKAKDAIGLIAPKANLDLVMDVELNVTLRFGQRQLPLREVLDLTSGSVVELDRQVDEPVELVLDGKVVARGEAVIIDGNYGMRITQVIQPFVP